MVLNDEVVVVAVIIGLTEVWKRLGLPKKFAPLCAVCLGIIVSLLSTQSLMVEIMRGFAVGLAAVGLYSSCKNVKEGLRGEG